MKLENAGIVLSLAKSPEFIKSVKAANKTLEILKNKILENLVSEYEKQGCLRASLGIQKMPHGFALMLNPDETHYFWLKHDGSEGNIHWDKWAVYRGARELAAEAESEE